MRKSALNKLFHRKVKKKKKKKKFSYTSLPCGCTLTPSEEVWWIGWCFFLLLLKCQIMTGRDGTYKKFSLDVSHKFAVILASKWLLFLLNATLNGVVCPAFCVRCFVVFYNTCLRVIFCAEEVHMRKGAKFSYQQSSKSTW